MIGRLTKLVIYNSLVFVSLIIFLDLILGDWKNFKKDQKNNASFPGFIKNRNLTFDARLLYDSKQAVPIIYSRDENGYRSKEINSKKQIILARPGVLTKSKRAAFEEGSF